MIVLLLLVLLASPGLEQERPPISAGDTVILSVADQAVLTNRFRVSSNGTLMLPLVGEIKVEGLSSDQLEADLRKRLSAYLVNPRVRVQVETTHRVFVFGAVPMPGSLELTSNMTLLEALSRSGYSGSSEVVVVRPQFRGPAAIDAPDAQVIRVNLRELEKDVEAGRLSRNLLLRDSDTIYVPADDANRIYVSGAVKKPGPYSIPEGTTVLQALSLAGGVTEKASLGRLRLTRVVEGEMRSLEASVDDAVEAGDTVIVPEKIPLPAIEAGLPRTNTADQPGQIRFGPGLSIRPVFAIKQFGVDNNVFNQTEPSTDFVFEVGPRLEAAADFERFQADAAGELYYVHYVKFATERSVNSAAWANVAFRPVSRLRLTAGGRTGDTRQRLDTVLDKRVRRLERTFDAGVEFQPLRRWTLEFSGRDFDRVVDEAHQAKIESITLTERVRSATSAVRFEVTPVTELFTSFTAATHRFELYPVKNSDATEVYVGGEFKDGALVFGTARIGYLRYLGLNDAAPDLESVVGGALLFWQPLDQTRFGLTLERTTGNTFQPEFAYDLVDRAGGSIRQGFLRQFDVLFETYRENHTYVQFARPDDDFRQPDYQETIQRYMAELGVRVQGLRFGASVNVDRRLSSIATRGYRGVRMLFSVSYGVFQARVI